jgi:hypothetical protein
MSAVNEILVEKEAEDSDFRAEDMNLRHKDCNGRLDLKPVSADENGWVLKCKRCHNQTYVPVGEDTIALVKTAIDGETRTLSSGQKVTQVPTKVRDELRLC